MTSADCTLLLVVDGLTGSKTKRQSVGRLLDQLTDPDDLTENSGRSDGSDVNDTSPTSYIRVTDVTYPVTFKSSTAFLITRLKLYSTFRIYFKVCQKFVSDSKLYCKLNP